MTDDIYESVESWKDLIDTNILFVTGQITETFYHGAPLNHETTDDPDFLNDIIQLNEKQIFTDESQPFVPDDQRSYVSIYCDVIMGIKILNRLRDNNKIHICYKTADSYFDNMNANRFNLTRTENNNESMAFYNRHGITPMTSTDEKWIEPTNWWNSNVADDKIRNSDLESFTKDSYPIIADLIHDSANIFIVSKSFTEELSAPKVLLDCINNM